jgi:3-hydroxyisobutyrate dehydrogenase-like beta-hydroxyacid dehydrogenase
MTTTVAFLGMGKMGRAMAAHIPDAGHELTVWNRTAAKAGEIDARIADTPAAAAAGAETVILMLADADAVRSVLFGGSGVVHGAAKHRLIIDASTIGPVASREIAVRLRESDLRYLDAPVCGSVAAATRATLTTFVGGDEEDIAQALPLLHGAAR